MTRMHRVNNFSPSSKAGHLSAEPSLINGPAATSRASEVVIGSSYVQLTQKENSDFFRVSPSQHRPIEKSLQWKSIRSSNRKLVRSTHAKGELDK